MAKFPALPIWTDAYLGDTTHLTTIEHGAYFLLLLAMWRTPECALPNDDKLLARYARLTAAQWRRVKPVIMPFFTVDGGHISQGRLTDERNAVRQRSKLQSDRRKARDLKNNNTGSTAVVPDANHQNQNHTQNQVDADDARASPTAIAEQLRERLCQRHNLDESKNHRWALASDITNWLRAGAEPEDIEAAIDGVMARSSASPNGWAYFRQAVADQKATREAGLPDGNVVRPNVIDFDAAIAEGARMAAENMKRKAGR